MKRRNLLTGFALAAAASGAEPPEAGSLYVPEAQRVEDRAFLHAFMDEYAFGDLVTAAPSIRVTHIPVMLDPRRGPNGTLYGHISRQNQQSRAFDGHQSAVVVFRGPHSYISPTWYSNPKTVPTWNFAVVHAMGKPRAIAEKKELHELMARLIGKFENRYGGSAYDFNKLPDDFVYPLMEGIVGFEMPIESLEGKFKLGQQRDEAGQASLVEHLRGAREGRDIAQFSADFFAWLKSQKPA